MPLHVEIEGEGPPLVLLHGFTQTCRVWGPFGDLLARDHMLLRVDLPGHGGSADVAVADLWETSHLVRTAVHHALAARGERPVYDLVGYSLGARVALHVALDTITRTEETPTEDGRTPRSVVLISGTGGIENSQARLRRRQADDSVAEDLETSGDAAQFIDRWLEGPMFSRLGHHAQPEERYRNTAAGLSRSLRANGTGTQEPLWARLAALGTPTLALAGADDARFAAYAVRIASSVPHGVASLVPGGGHAVHLAQPRACWRIVEHWLSGIQKEESRREKSSHRELEP